LGRSKTGTFPLNIVWGGTGNNIHVVGDMPRRVAQIRLRTMLENPEERADFQHPRLLEWAAANRAELVASAMTLLRGYYAAGRPSQGLVPWGSFEAWSDLVRSTAVWAGLPDPGETRKKGARDDTLVRSLSGLLTGLKAFDPAGKGLTAAEIIQRVTTPEESQMKMAAAVREALAFLCETQTADLPGPHALGMRLASLRERRVGDCYLTSHLRNHTLAWFVAQIEPGGSGASGAISGRSTKELSTDRNSGE
jgi:hypothetical protein